MTEIMLWRRLDLPGHEIAKLEALDDGWKLEGTAIFRYHEGPSRLDYVVICDATWRTNSAQVKGMIGPQQIDLVVSVDAERHWHLNGAECVAVEESADIDLGFSPSTNLLPIRRLALAVGDQAEVKAAWLPFPSLKFERLHQVYRRLEEKVYRYESGHGSFVRTLEVNSSGFVTSYPGLWRAESAELDSGLHERQ
jgi:hypothetical protein